MADHVLRALARMPWALLPEKLEAVAELITFHAAGGRRSPEEIAAAVGDGAAGRRVGTQLVGPVAVIPVLGVLAYRMNLMANLSGGGGTSVQLLTQAVRDAVADPAVKAILLDVDSPGGQVDGIPELFDVLMRARQDGTRVVAVCNTLAASAAYWLAAAADEVVVSPSGQAGSIGVYTVHLDQSEADAAEGRRYTLVSAGKYKTEGHPYGPLDAEAQAALQAKVDQLYEMFIKSVAKGRGVAPSAVRDGFGQGRLLTAEDAVAQKLADRVGTIDETLARLVGRYRSGGRPAGTRAEGAPSPRLAAAAALAEVADQL